MPTAAIAGRECERRGLLAMRCRRTEGSVAQALAFTVAVAVVVAFACGGAEVVNGGRRDDQEGKERLDKERRHSLRWETAKRSRQPNMWLALSDRQ